MLIRTLAVFLLCSASAQAQIEIQWWHSMGGALGEKVGDLAGKFNASQKEYKVVPVYKGQYPESMTAAIAAFRAGNAPHILQVFEVGTATMMAAKGAVVPVAKIMADARSRSTRRRICPRCRATTPTSRGNMLSFPFNSSTALFLHQRRRAEEGGHRRAEDLEGSAGRRPTS
jgi:sn-glycerol 3-phosphate transport system substrate-binding protein